MEVTLIKNFDSL